jgi:hypothetical protein
MNPKDPLNKVPENSYVLFSKLSAECEGFTAQDVVSAAVNLLLNALRQANPKRTNALRACDELTGKMKATLSEHYNEFSGERNNIFPFAQNLEMPLIKFPTTWPS